MKVTYLKLENVAGLVVGSNLSNLEIDFSNSINKIVAIVAPNTAGKAVPNSTKIPTPDGYKLMGDIKSGDFVFNWKGEPVRVIGVFPQGLKDVYEIEFSYGKKARCCKDHLWEYIRHSHESQYVKTDTLENIMNNYCNEDMSFNNVRLKNNRSVQYKSRPIPIDPYVLGVFIGNGCCREGALTISCLDDEIVKKICNIYDLKYKKNSGHNYSYNFTDLNGKPIRTRNFFKDIPEMINAYSYEKHIPEDYLYNTEWVRWQLLKGLIDTDGCVCTQEDRPGAYALSYSTTSRRLTEDIVQLVRSLGLNTTVTYDKRVEKYHSGFCAEIRIIGDLTYMLDRICSVSYKYQKLFNVLTSTAFRNKALNKTAYEYNYFKKVTKLDYQEEMTCITVDDPDHLFLTEDFVVTHNSVLMSSIQPFAGVCTIDERSTLPYIVKGMNGYKEIHYSKGADEYIIKHYWTPNNDTHSVKSYFMKNGEELNENGNVTSFNALVETHFGLTQEMMRLVRIGSNVNSFISLAPARRKEYIGKLIEEIDVYIQIYKKINDDIRVIKTMLQANATSIKNCHIADIEEEKNNLSDINKSIVDKEKNRDELIKEISKLDTLISANDINDLRNKKREAESSLYEYESTKKNISDMGLENKTLEMLNTEKNRLVEEKINIQSQINSYRLSIDQLMNQIERLNDTAKKLSSSNDVNSLKAAIDHLKGLISKTPNVIKNFSIDTTSNEVYQCLCKMQSLNQISKIIIAFGDKPIKMYIALIEEKKSVDKWLKQQSQNIKFSLSKEDVKSLIKVVVGDDGMIMPNCDTEFKECPFYRISEMLMQLENDNESEITAELLTNIQSISDNMALVLNIIDLMNDIHIPKKIVENFSEKSVLERLEKHLPFFDLTELEEFLSIVKDAELYRENVNRLKEYEHKLMMYQQSGVESIIEEISQHRNTIGRYNSELEIQQNALKRNTVSMKKIDEVIELVSKFNELKKQKDSLKESLDNIDKVLEPLETASQQKQELSFKLQHLTNSIAAARDQHRLLEAKINNYNRLLDEASVLMKKNKDLTMISDAVSTKKGIPVYYMKKYLVKIQKITNELLSIIYGNEFQLVPFVVTPDSFEIPYKKNGKVIKDIKYSSQSELSLTAMALSFALSTNSSTEYNIPLIDEVDGGLDSTNRLLFLKMLDRQINMINAEQVFIISHNLSQMSTVPMDCICLSPETKMISKLQNIIYQ